MGHGSPGTMKWVRPLQNLLLLLLALHLRHAACASFWFRVPEEQEPGTLAGSLSQHYPPPYQLLTRDFLRMDEITGDFYTTETRMDREALCPEESRAEECIILHNAVVGPSGDLIQFPLIVQDLNDNPPRFPNAEIRLRVSEDVAEGTAVLLDERAVDVDAGQNGRVGYRLEGSDGAFGLRVGDGGLALLVEAALDRETQDEHRMMLVAADGGREPLSATATLIVEVTDVDDNCPSFGAGGPLRVQVPGDAEKNTLVARVRAADPDTGANAAIAYSLSPRVSERARKLFSLDSLTGHIRLAQDLRSDTPEELQLRVLASGRGCPPADTRVSVSILPAAKRELTVRIRFIAEHRDQTVVLAENQPPTALAVLELEGGGGGGGGLEGSSLSIENEGPFALSRQDGRYLLSTSAPLDREAQSQHEVSLLAEGGGTDGAALAPSRRVIRVMVADLNDNAPRFLQTAYQLEVEENGRPGRSLLRVSATDPDGGANGRVTYRLGDCQPPVFRIHPETGQLTAAAALDREQRDLHVLSVFARDGGSPPLESVVTVSVRVLDQNDNAPVFPTPHFIFFVPEDVAPSTRVGRVEASDPDQGENGHTALRLAGSGGAFVLDGAEGGALLVAGPLDRETEQRHELLLLASDHGRPLALTSTARVTVFVQDVNDNPPAVTVPGGNSSCTPVSTQTPPGTTVARVLAVDRDSGLNSQITYTVVAPPAATAVAAGPFRLDSGSGNITTAGPLRPEHLGMHHLFVVARDGGQPVPLYTTVWVNLLVGELAEPCRLDRAPNWTGTLDLVPFPSKASLCEAGGGRYAQLTLLAGAGMMLASVCLLAAAAALWSRGRSPGGRSPGGRGRGRGEEEEEENGIPLRLKDKYYSED